MTLFVPQWATNLNYSTGPASGTPTKVDPSSTPNGFIPAVIAAPQHVNFLIHGLSAEIVKAIDGLNGGSYALGANLTFAAGAEVRFANVARVMSGGLFTVNSGGTVTLASGSTLNLDGAVDIDGNVDLDAAAVFTVHGEIALATSGSGELSVASGAIINVNSGGRIDLNTGSELNVEGTAHIDVEASAHIDVLGTLNLSGTGLVKAGGTLIVQDDGTLQVQAGGTLHIGDTDCVVLDDLAEGYRLTLTPAFHDLAGQWQKTPNASPTLGWVQSDVADDRSIWFALPCIPGDTIVDVYARVEAEDHPGGLPATMPRLELLSVDIDGVIHVHATAVDQSPTESAYDGLHNIVLAAGVGVLESGTMPHLATADPLYVRLRGEKGANAVTGLCLRTISGNIIARSYRAASMVY